jgi:hypothetical protein
MSRNNNHHIEDLSWLIGGAVIVVVSLHCYNNSGGWLPLVVVLFV